MKIKITAFGIAKEIIGHKHIELVVNSSQISDVRNQLVKQFPDFEKLASLKFAVNTNYQEDSYRLNEDDEVVLIPPVSGG